MSKNESVKNRTENSSAEIGKTILSRSGSISNAKLNDDKVTSQDEGFETTFRAIKPRIEANIARKLSGHSRRSTSRKGSGKAVDTKVTESIGQDDGSAQQIAPAPANAADEAFDKEKTELQALEIEKLRNRLEFHMKKNKQLEEEKLRITEDRDETMKTIESLLGQNRELTSENTTLREQQMVDSRTIDDLQKNVHALEQRMQKLKEENRMLNETNLKAMKELNNVDQEKSDLSKSYKGQNVEMKKMVQERQRDVAKLQQSEQRLSKLKSECAVTTRQLESLRGDIKKYKEVIDDLRMENRRLKINGQSSMAPPKVAPTARAIPSRGRK